MASTLVPEELVEVIVEQLFPWSKPEAAVRDEVREEVAQLSKRIEDDIHWPAKWQSAHEILPALTNLIDVLSALPADHLLFRMCGPGERHELLKRLHHLRQMHSGIEELKPPPTNYDRSARRCAQAAVGLIFNVSRKKPTGTVEGPMRTVASILYKVVTGKRGMDLKRACDDVLRGIDAARKNMKAPVHTDEAKPTLEARLRKEIRKATEDEIKEILERTREEREEALAEQFRQKYEEIIEDQVEEMKKYLWKRYGYRAVP
jgi:hypothetical protein